MLASLHYIQHAWGLGTANSQPTGYVSPYARGKFFHVVRLGLEVRERSSKGGGRI